MSVYFYTIIAVAVLSMLAIEMRRTVKTKNNTGIVTRKGKWETVGLVAIAAVLIFVAGMRYYVGTDYGGYYKIFLTPPLDLSQSIIKLDEPVFPLLALIIGLFTKEGAVFIFVTAAFTLGAILYTTYKQTDAYLFVSLMIIFTGIWHGSFNGVRQYFAAAIICLGYKYIFKKDFWKYLIFVLLAFLVHKSAIVAIIPYFILRNKISVKNVFFLTLGSVVLLYNYEAIFSLIGALKDEIIDTSNPYTVGQVNILRVIVNVVPAIYCLILYSKTDKDEEMTFHLNILILYALLSIIGMNSPYLSRVNIYLGVMLPLSMGKLIVFKDKREELLVKSIIVALYFLFWIYEISISQDLNSFKWIWEREI